jgi:hypothetical protein
VLDLFERTPASFKAQVVGQVDVTHASLSDAFANAITAAQHFSGF